LLGNPPYEDPILRRRTNGLHANRTGGLLTVYRQATPSFLYSIETMDTKFEDKLFASGCRLLINVTSSGQILPEKEPPFFVLVEKALRDEGTSYHYLPPSDFALIDDKLLNLLDGAVSNLATTVYRGATWTTDAPFRETEHAIKQAGIFGILAVEREAAALYAFAQARSRPVVCFAHVTNRMGNVEGDFEKGEANGSRDALQLIAVTAKTWLSASGHET